MNNNLNINESIKVIKKPKLFNNPKNKILSFNFANEEISSLTFNSKLKSNTINKSEKNITNSKLKYQNILKEKINFNYNKSHVDRFNNKHYNFQNNTTNLHQLNNKIDFNNKKSIDSRNTTSFIDKKYPYNNLKNKTYNSPWENIINRTASYSDLNKHNNTKKENFKLLNNKFSKSRNNSFLSKKSNSINTKRVLMPDKYNDNSFKLLDSKSRNFHPINSSFKKNFDISSSSVKLLLSKPLKNKLESKNNNYNNISLYKSKSFYKNSSSLQFNGSVQGGDLFKGLRKGKAPGFVLKSNLNDNLDYKVCLNKYKLYNNDNKNSHNGYAGLQNKEKILILNKNFNNKLSNSCYDNKENKKLLNNNIKTINSQSKIGDLFKFVKNSNNNYSKRNKDKVCNIASNNNLNMYSNLVFSDIVEYSSYAEINILSKDIPMFAQKSENRLRKNTNFNSNKNTSNYSNNQIYEKTLDNSAQLIVTPCSASSASNIRRGQNSSSTVSSLSLGSTSVCPCSSSSDEEKIVCKASPPKAPKSRDCPVPQGLDPYELSNVKQIDSDGTEACISDNKSTNVVGKLGPLSYAITRPPYKITTCDQVVIIPGETFSNPKDFIKREKAWFTLSAYIINSFDYKKPDQKDSQNIKNSLMVERITNMPNDIYGAPGCIEFFDSKNMNRIVMCFDETTKNNIKDTYTELLKCRVNGGLSSISISKFKDLIKTSCMGKDITISKFQNLSNLLKKYSENKSSIFDNKEDEEKLKKKLNINPAYNLVVPGNLE